MEDMSDMATLFATKVKSDGASEISPVERLLNEFEAHEAKEEKSLEQYRKSAELRCRILSRGFSCNSLSRTRKSIARSFMR